jgi:hypothetical protein
VLVSVVEDGFDLLVVGAQRHGGNLRGMRIGPVAHTAIAVLLGLPLFSGAMIVADAVFLPDRLLTWLMNRAHFWPFLSNPRIEGSVRSVTVFDDAAGKSESAAGTYGASDMDS